MCVAGPTLPLPSYVVRAATATVATAAASHGKVANDVSWSIGYDHRAAILAAFLVR